MTDQAARGGERIAPDRGHVRSDGEVDADRLLYADAFRRLTGVTQVVTPRDELVQHDRLTHSLKVAQVARRMAEHLRREAGADVDPETATVYFQSGTKPPLSIITKLKVEPKSGGKGFLTSKVVK